jgi:hypothetical protein
MLATTICPLTGVGVAIAFGSTRYFTAMQNVGQVKSSVDDLTMERGTVSMRVAFVLRSAEVQPLFRDLCDGALVCVCVCDITLTHLARGQFYPPPTPCKSTTQYVRNPNNLLWAPKHPTQTTPPLRGLVSATLVHPGY